MSKTFNDIIDEMIDKEEYNDIIKIIINSTYSITTDPYKLNAIIMKCYPIRNEFKDWNRIIDIVLKYYKTINFEWHLADCYKDKETEN